jgi:hypothetical protein
MSVVVVALQLSPAKEKPMNSDTIESGNSGTLEPEDMRKGRNQSAWTQSAVCLRQQRHATFRYRVRLATAQRMFQRAADRKK